MYIGIGTAVNHSGLGVGIFDRGEGLADLDRPLQLVEAHAYDAYEVGQCTRTHRCFEKSFEGYWMDIEQYQANHPDRPGGHGDQHPRVGAQDG